MLNTSWSVVANFSSLPNTSSQICDPYAAADSASERALIATGYAVIFLFSLIGNILVIAVFYKRYDQLRTPANHFIINMAVSDLIVPICVIPRRIKETYLGFGPWQIGGVFGDLLCRVVEFTDEVSTSVSALSMVLIAVERFRSIVFPRKHPLMSKRATRRFIFFTWVFPILFFSYYLVAYRLVDNGTPYCAYGIPEVFDTWEDLWRVDRLSLLIIFVLIPFALLVVSYTAIIVSFYRRKQIASHLSSQGQKIRTKRNKRVTRMLVIVVSVFFISWTPYYVYFFKQYYSLGPKWPCESIRRLYLVTRCMNYIYTAINPLIYYTFSTTYRQGFHELLSCSQSRCLCCRSTDVREVSIISRSTNEARSFRTKSEIQPKLSNQIPIDALRAYNTEDLQIEEIENH